ncbi:MAG: hypothetical protein M1823_006973, partial [Watsoniomyces obsoletus]
RTSADSNVRARSSLTLDRPTTRTTGGTSSSPEATYADRRRTPGPGFRRRTSSPSSNGRHSRTGCEMRLSPTACERWRPPADTAKPRNRPDSESPSLSPTLTAWKRTWRNSKNTFGRMPFSWGYDPKLRLRSWRPCPRRRPGNRLPTSPSRSKRPGTRRLEPQGAKEHTPTAVRDRTVSEPTVADRSHPPDHCQCERPRGHPTQVQTNPLADPADKGLVEFNVTAAANLATSPAIPPRAPTSVRCTQKP